MLTFFIKQVVISDTCFKKMGTVHRNNGVWGGGGVYYELITPAMFNVFHICSDCALYNQII